MISKKEKVAAPEEAAAEAPETVDVAACPAVMVLEMTLVAELEAEEVLEAVEAALVLLLMLEEELEAEELLEAAEAVEVVMPEVVPVVVLVQEDPSEV